MRAGIVSCVWSLVVVGCNSGGPIAPQDASTAYDYGCAVSTLGCPCDPNSQCLRGMTCVANICVLAPETGVDADADALAVDSTTADASDSLPATDSTTATDSAAATDADSTTATDSDAATDADSATDAGADADSDSGADADADAATDSAPDAAQDSATCPTKPVVINEIQTGGTTASDEFVELYNANNCAIDLTGYTLMYEAATGTTPSTLVTLAATIPAHGFLVYAGSGFTGTANGTWSGGLASTGGAVALQTGTTIVHSVGWGTAANSFVEVAPATAPLASQSIGLYPDGVCVFNNSLDFGVRSSPTPGAANL